MTSLGIHCSCEDSSSIVVDINNSIINDHTINTYSIISHTYQNRRPIKDEGNRCNTVTEQQRIVITNIH